MKSEKLIQTYVWHEDGRAFFVSTINRDASTLEPMTFAETLIWEWDEVKRERGKLIGEAEDITDSIYVHCEIIKRLRIGIIHEESVK